MKLQKHYIIGTIIILAALFTLTGCGLFEDPFPRSTRPRRPRSEAAEHTRVTVRELEPEPTAVEILWQAEEPTAERYLIRYGYNSADLDLEKTVLGSDLKPSHDQRFGACYRTVLYDIDPRKTLYVTITAVIGDVQSAPSTMATVSPAQ